MYGVTGGGFVFCPLPFDFGGDRIATPFGDFSWLNVLAEVGGGSVVALEMLDDSLEGDLIGDGKDSMEDPEVLLFTGSFLGDTTRYTPSLYSTGWKGTCDILTILEGNNLALGPNSSYAGGVVRFLSEQQQAVWLMKLSMFNFIA